MDERLKRHLEEALKEYSSGLHYQTLIEAKNEYFSRTEQINDEDEDYENRMKSFNDWYILQFISRRGTHTVIKDYLMKNKNQIDDAITKTLLNINHSLFEFLDENMRGEVILKDILHNEKQALAQDHPHPVLLKNDLFVGRVLAFKEQFYLMDGMCFLPKEVKPILKKHSKRIRKLKDTHREMEFLLKIEAAKTKWTRYGHIGAAKIFSMVDF